MSLGSGDPLKTNPKTASRTQTAAKAVERLLDSHKIRLTMGGEPTFVPLEPDGDEWNTAALGPTKITFARRLAAELVRTHHQGALVSQFYGKQYPGEPLPRWNIIIHDLPGRALWKEPARLLLGEPAHVHTDLTVGEAAAALASDLGLTRYLRPASESRPDEPVRGWVLPLDHVKGKWTSDDWGLPPGAPVHPLHGDSSLGLRLPLGSLPEGTLHRALTIEWKDGALEIFFPPLVLTDYLKLLDRVAALAHKHDWRDLVISGYPPEKAGLLRQLILASDPGVIEVNTPPYPRWSQFAACVRKLHRAAAAVGMRAAKLHYNGNIHGTGGGAHICFGGPTPALSPILTLHHLLPGLVRFLQNHPCLGYLFSGQYIGPSSQAPRIDESTYEAVTELEIAFPGAARVAGNPYLFGMLFRDLLMDRTGNTHRAELSIDKMWNTFAPNGTTGIVEFRAIESTPGPEDLNLIALLLRAIIARLAVQPYTRPFVRFGHSLHDRYFLPVFLRDDLLTVLADLKRHGIPINPALFDPFLQFRLPLYGVLRAGVDRLEVRHALEAWPLLGEQPSGAFTARFIDSSTERLEFRTTSAAAKRAKLIVNGREVPLKQHGSHMIAGFRFRAFYRVPALHPHIPSQSPLTLAWTDRRTGKVLDAAVWHSWQPNGEPYSHRPRDEKEADQRRAERWIPCPALIGRPLKSRPLPSDPDRYTHDFRRVV